MFPGLFGCAVGDELQGDVGVPGEAVRDDGGLPTVQEPLADATVLLVGDRLLPLARADERPDAFGQEDAPQPLAAVWRSSSVRVRLSNGAVAVDVGCVSRC